MKNLFENVSIVIPAYNEENGIGPTLDNLIKRAKGAEIIVIDDGSTDNTFEIASKYKDVLTIQHEFNRGYGGALKTGMRKATRKYVAWFDADNEHNFADLENMVQKIQDIKLAAVIGQRYQKSTSRVRGIGKFVIYLIALLLGYKGNRDMNCGLRVYRTSVINNYLHLLPDGYSASTTSLMIMLERKYPLIYSKVTVSERIGTSKVKLKNGFETIMLVINLAMLFSPMRIFGGLAASFIIVGVAYGSYTAIGLGNGISGFAVLTTVLGVLFAILGLIASQISQMRLAEIRR